MFIRYLGLAYYTTEITEAHFFGQESSLTHRYLWVKLDSCAKKASLHCFRTYWDWVAMD